MAKKTTRRTKSMARGIKPKRGVDAALKGDRTCVALTIEGRPELQLDVAALEELQKRLGEARAGMVPEVSASVPVGAPISAISNPHWVISPVGGDGDALLNIRDPRHGWLHFVIPAGEGRKLSDFFEKLFSSLPPGRP